MTGCFATCVELRIQLKYRTWPYGTYGEERVQQKTRLLDCWKLFVMSRVYRVKLCIAVCCKMC